MEKNRKIILFIIVCTLLLSTYYFVHPKKQTETKLADVLSKTTANRDIAIKELSEKYQAVTGWEKNLLYTFQAQERLITARPVVFTGNISDIYNRDGKNFVRFNSAFLNRRDSSSSSKDFVILEINYALELECERQILDKLVAQKPNFIISLPNEYAVVAKIYEVKKPILTLVGLNSHELELETDNEYSKMFIAKGTCIDITRIDSDILSR